MQCFRLKLELLMNIDQPIDENGAHLQGDIELTGHVIGVWHESMLSVNKIGMDLRRKLGDCEMIGAVFRVDIEDCLREFEVI